MKKILVAITLLIGFNAQAQILEPVKLSFSSNKIGEHTYEIHLKATIDKGWHIFSMHSNQENGIGPLPTEIAFANNNNVILQGNLKEVGELQNVYDEIFEVNVKYYEDEVDFVQLVKTKTNEPIVLKGSITYMACRKKQCLAPQDVDFEITLN